MAKDEDLRKKFDLKVAYQRRNKKYEESYKQARARVRKSKYPIIEYDPFTMTNDELWEFDNKYKFDRISKYDPSIIDWQKTRLSLWLKREPTAKELLDYLKQGFDSGRYIHFDPNAPMTTLLESFRKIVKEEKVKKDNVPQPEEDKDFLSGYRIKELERYLAVYDARETIVNGKKMKWVSVWQKLFPKKDSKEYDEEVRQCLLRDYRKASEIIKKSIM